jgi:hypothetical protein
VVPQVRVPEATKRMVPRLVRSSVRVDVVQFLQRFMQMATDDVRRRERLSCASAELEAGLSVANELLEKGGNRRVDVNLTKAIRCLETLFDPAVMNFLLEGDGQEICRDVFVDLNAKRLTDSQTSSAGGAGLPETAETVSCRSCWISFDAHTQQIGFSCCMARAQSVSHLANVCMFC